MFYSIPSDTISFIRGGTNYIHRDSSSTEEEAVRKRFEAIIHQATWFMQAAAIASQNRQVTFKQSDLLNTFQEYHQIEKIRV